MNAHARRGQSLIELVIAITIGVLFITAGIGVITLSLRIDFQNKFSQTAGELTQEVIERVSTFANADWHNIDLAPRQTPLHLTENAGFFSLGTASTTVVIDDLTYETSFVIETVCRDNQDSFVSCPAGTEDPTTLAIHAATSWQQSGETSYLRLTHYLTRNRDRVWLQSDWSTGSSTWDGSTPFTTATMSGGYFSNATNTAWSTAGQLTIADLSKNLRTTSGNGIDPTYRYAWNDVVGWFDFRATNTVFVGSTITGYARSTQVGDLALDCATTPNGNICNSSTFNVAQDANGILDGYGWNDTLGWISFNCSNSNNCATAAPCPTTNPSCTGANGVDYNVRIDGAGNFFGWAWNDVVGWVSFNCDHSQDTVPGINYCATGGNGTSVDYSVKTGGSQVSWAELSSIAFDTERALGAGFNTIMWQGSMPTDTIVKFQIAGSDSDTQGPWDFVGPDGTSGTYYQPTGPNVPLRINRTILNNKRYVAYRIILESDPSQSLSPQVDDVILNWSH
jgi:hypothetical protein